MGKHKHPEVYKIESYSKIFSENKEKL